MNIWAKLKWPNWRAGLICLCLSLLGVYGVLSWRDAQTKRYEGRTLNEWVLLLNDPSAKQAEVARMKLGGLGAEAVPILLSELRCKEWEPANSLRRLLNELLGVSIRHVPAWRRAYLASTVFHPTNRTTLAAIPQFADMLSAPDVGNRNLPDWSASMLLAIGEPTLPELITRANTNRTDRLQAIQILSGFECSGKSIGPHMIRDRMVSAGFRPEAPYNRAQIGPEAERRIIDALDALSNDPSREVRSAATNALAAFCGNNSFNLISK